MVLPVLCKHVFCQICWISTTLLLFCYEKNKQWWSSIPPISAKRTTTSKQWWSTISPISTKWTITSHLNSLKKNKKNFANLGPGLGQAQNCGWVKQLMGSQPSPFDNWIFNGITFINKTCTDLLLLKKTHTITTRWTMS